MDLNLGAALGFLGGLRAHNRKDWFEANRGRYEEAMAQFETLVGQLISGLGRFEDLDGLTPRDCIMRIHRDVRFSRDKSPYKDGFGAVIVRGGRRSGRFGYYLHLAPEGETRLAGGMHDPSPAQLARFREAVVRDPKDLQAILHSAPFRRHFVGLRGDSLKTVPRGYPTDHPRVDLLRLKQAYVMEQVPDAVVLSPTFPRLAVDCYKAMKPLLDWINGVAAANASRRSLTVSRSRRRP